MGAGKREGKVEGAIARLGFVVVRCLPETFWAQIVLWMDFWAVVGMCQGISAHS